ncbi:MAG: hypothetical protein IPK83_21665 [Planctomycetes bacterium]|nr:hypothetical protein [Planctomycetota bacterium]
MQDQTFGLFREYSDMRNLGFLVLVGVLFGLSSRASAALILVHDNGGLNYPDGLLSDPTFPVQTGDDFQVNQSTKVTRVTWFGAYKGGDMLPDGPDHFSLRFFTFVGPTTPNSTPFADLELTDVLRTPTALTLTNGAPVFSYQADFTPVDFVTGRHLLSIVNDTTGYPEQWGWNLSNGVTGQRWHRFQNGTNWFGPYSAELSFRIYAVPEIGTGAMMGVAGLVVLRRRGRR